MTTLRNLEPATTYGINIGANKETEELNGLQANINVTTAGRIDRLCNSHNENTIITQVSNKTENSLDFYYGLLTLVPMLI